eukprot:scaffold21700_cov164-Amphora_coffeaeformis.AAC.3
MCGGVNWGHVLSCDVGPSNSSFNHTCLVETTDMPRTHHQKPKDGLQTSSNFGLPPEVPTLCKDYITKA